MHTRAVYCFLVFVVGCAQVPRPSTYPYTFQQKMQAAEQWKVLANQVAEQVVSVLKSEPSFLMESIYIRSDERTNSINAPSDDRTTSHNAPCYDRTPFKDTTFAQAFHSLLITELINQEISIANNPDNRFQICWTIQPVVHNENRSKPYPSLAEAILAIPPSLFVDIWQGIEAGPLPHSEIIFTATITDWGVIRSRNARKAYIFYINDKDWQHYWSVPGTPQKSFAVVGR